MSDKIDADELDLSDAELMEVLKNHGIDRRSVMKALGVGAGAITLGSGTAAADHTSIDPVWGEPVGFDQPDKTPPASEHLVELHAHEHPVGDHDDFPILSDVKNINFSQQLIVSHPLGKGVGKGSEVPVEFFFNPVGLHVEPGDVVEFKSHSHEHTATTFNPRFGLPPRAPTGFSSPPILGFPDAGPDGLHDSWFYEFTTPGVYDLLCLPHFPFGMVMRIVVADNEEQLSTFTDYPDLPDVDVFDNANRVLNAPEIDDPADIGINGEIAWADLTL